MTSASTSIALSASRGDRPAVRRPAHQHATATIALHWASAAVLLLSAGAVIARAFAEQPGLRSVLLDIHRQAGLAVLLTWVLRLALRRRHGMARDALVPPWWERAAAQATHLALYLVLLALPLLGVATSQAHAVPVRLLGLWRLPALVAADAELADQLSDWHAWTAWALLALVALHVAAAVWHHVVRRDGVLTAMLPLLRRRA